MYGLIEEMYGMIRRKSVSARYKLVTWIAVVLGPSAMFTFVFLQPVVLCTESVRCLDRY